MDVKFNKTLYLKNQIIKNKQYSSAKFIAAKLIIEDFNKKHIVEIENFIIKSCDYINIIDYFNSLGENNIVQKEKFKTYMLFV